MAAWTDSHCHLPSLDEPEAALERAHAAGVTQVVSVGTDLASSEQCVALATAHAGVSATVGLHPHDASRLDAEWDALERLARSDGVVGIGETGFDLHYRHSPPADQERAFRAHVRLAHRLGLALVVHTREAWDDTFRVLESEDRPAEVVFHCFTGGPAEAHRALRLGASLSFSGIASFKGADDVREAAALTPPDRLLVETDAPYLAPVPHRGRRNEPAFVVDVGRAVAGARGEPAERVAEASAATARRVFGPGSGPGG